MPQNSVFSLSELDITKHTGLIITKNRQCVLKPALMAPKQHRLLIKTSLLEQLLQWHYVVHYHTNISYSAPYSHWRMLTYPNLQASTISHHISH